MKSIKKITDKVTNNVSSLAGSALLVGATLTGGAAFAAAQSGSSGSSMDLGDYPQPFVTEDGEVDTSIVIGSDAATIDVVGAVEIAGSLGNAAFGEESVSVSGGTSGSWSAENGVTLNRQNSNLFLNDATNAEQTSLDEADLNVLETTSFQSEDNEEVELEHEVDVAEQDQNFNPAGDNDDPLLHVTNPTNPDEGAENHLFSATVEFSDTVDFSEAGEDNPGDDVQGDEWIEDGDTIEMFGNEYTYSDESSGNELVLYGSSDRVEVNTGESTTVTVDGDEVQLESTYVSEDGTSATVVVGGTTENVEEGDSVGPNGNIRISDIYRTGPDGQGRVAFSQGSDEVVINYGETGGSLGDVEVDGDDVDGVAVAVDSGSNNDFTQTDGLTFYFGGTDSDENYVAAGETYEDPLFGTLEFHYGGLSGDVEENPAEEIEVNAAEDGEATVTLNDGEDSTDVVFATNDQDGDNDAATTPVELAGDSGEFIATYEGERLEEDDYVVLNANEDSGMYQVTDLTSEVDTIDDGASAEGEVSVTLENVVTGDSVTIEEDGVQQGDLDGSNDGPYTLDSESVEGKDFDVTFHEGETEVSLTRTGESSIQVYPTLYTSSDAAMAFTEKTDSFVSQTVNLSEQTDGSDIYEQTIELPSTAVSSANEATIDVNDDGDDQVSITVGDSAAETLQTDGTNTANIEFAAAEQVYQLNVSVSDTSTQNGDTTGTDNMTTLEHSIQVDEDQDETSNTNANEAALGPSVAVVQPEDDEDEEHGFFFTPDVSDDDNGDIAVTYTGPAPSSGYDGDVSENAWLTDDLDSEDDMTVGYTDYGAYTEHDTDDDEMFTLSLPSGQSTAGMAVTGTDGDISQSGGGGSATAAQPTYEMADGVLDTDGNVNQVKNNENVIVVGGPNANSLTQELVDDNQTMPASDYTEGQGMIQMVDGWSSGNSALVVAGYSGEDTRAAAEFLADYRNNQDDLEGQSEVTIETSSGSVVSN